MIMKNFKPYVDKIVPYEPGRPIEEVERELGLKHVIKLASNENPLGSSPKAVKAMQAALNKVFLYPDGGSYYLKNKIFETYKIPVDQIVIGNGSNEIIELVARGFLKEGDNVVSSETSFLVYPLIASTCGAEFRAAAMKDFRFDLPGILKQIDSRTRIVFIANPNNPTGTYVTKKEVDDFLKQVPEHVLVCFDEAYIDFVEAKDFPDTTKYVLAGKKNVIVLRTFSKSYGLAGLRIGVGFMTKEMCVYLDKVRQPFNVNRLAQEAACAALDDQAFLEKTKKLILAGRKYLYQELKKMNLTFVPSQANFILIDVKRDGTELFRTLMKKGIIVRAMAAYQLKNYIRVTIGTRVELKRFIKELKEILI